VIYCFSNGRAPRECRLAPWLPVNLQPRYRQALVINLMMFLRQLQSLQRRRLVQHCHRCLFQSTLSGLVLETTVCARGFLQVILLSELQ